jgi:hypothetical protein
MDPLDELGSALQDALHDLSDPVVADKPTEVPAPSQGPLDPLSSADPVGQSFDLDLLGAPPPASGAGPKSVDLLAVSSHGASTRVPSGLPGASSVGAEGVSELHAAERSAVDAARNPQPGANFPQLRLLPRQPRA